MPDVRQTPLLDDFNYPDENPISNGGKWQAVASNRPPMQKLNTLGGTRRACRSCTGTPACRNCYSGWNVASFSGDVEVWGQRLEVGFQLGHNERLALLTDINPATSGDKSGYYVFFHQQVGQHNYSLYKLSGGVTTLLAEVQEDENLVLLRRNGSFVEVWDAPEADPTNWTMRIQVTDTTFTTGLWLVMGEGDNNTSSSQLSGWVTFGGGIPTPAEEFKPQIIRWVFPPR